MSGGKPRMPDEAAGAIRATDANATGGGAAHRAELISAMLGLWVLAGAGLDAWAHVNEPNSNEERHLTV